ncbi:aldehyde dehydrogenase (acceptor) [Pseudomonas mandelii JR-1]|uniref:Aldehyde dehydrogenase (Acceptor) n=1 Tax=Pseudomonas mandelii JR-1 TaxID=1147786 RepID=A0A024EDQ7_9PSED|nr:aldehyde dehydrogenase (acceptor) [Pseudomonas mandelii JR-1]
MLNTSAPRSSRTLSGILPSQPDFSAQGNRHPKPATGEVSIYLT